MRTPPWSVGLLALAVGCGPPAWSAARRAGTADAYEQFARDNASTPQARAALARAEALRWQQAEQTGSAAAWSAYLRVHHGSDRADEARSRVDAAAYQEALEDKDALALERYLAMFPDGAHRVEARDHLDAVRWQEAKQEDSHLSYRRYLMQSERGDHRDEAEQRYAERLWERAQRYDDLRSYRAYLEELPGGAHGAEATARIAALQFTSVSVVVALGTSWNPDRKAALAALHQAAQADLPARLKGLGFAVEGIAPLDLGPGADPAAAPRGAGGTLVILVDDAQGEPFEPRGFATTMKASMTLFSAGRPGAMAAWEAVGATPDSVRALDESGLYRGAAAALLRDVTAQAGRLLPWHPAPP